METKTTRELFCEMAKVEAVTVGMTSPDFETYYPTICGVRRMSFGWINCGAIEFASYTPGGSFWGGVPIVENGLSST